MSWAGSMFAEATAMILPKHEHFRKLKVAEACTAPRSLFSRVKLLGVGWGFALLLQGGN